MLNSKITNEEKGELNERTWLRFTIVSIQTNGHHVCTAFIFKPNKLLSTASCADKILKFVEEKNSRSNTEVRACNYRYPRPDKSKCPPITAVEKAKGYKVTSGGVYDGPYAQENFALFKVSPHAYTNGVNIFYYFYIYR